MPTKKDVERQTAADEEEICEPFQFGCDDAWTWNKLECSHEVRLTGLGNRQAMFHPNWSSGTAGVRGTRVLNNARFYWEVRMSHRIFGTSMMVGVCTKKARLHADRFVNLIGEDENGWGLSHKGFIWHAGQWTSYTKPFRENEATTIGVLFDGITGTITFYKDGKCLGVAFKGLDKVKEPLYPAICSTAAKTEMTLGTMKRDFVNLQDRCRAVIVMKIMEVAESSANQRRRQKTSAECEEEALNQQDCLLDIEPTLQKVFLPPPLKLYLAEALQEANMIQSMDSAASNLRWRTRIRYNFPEGCLDIDDE